MMKKYHIFEMIGEGSFGRVYKGRRKFSGEIVALKLISKIGFSKYELRNLKREIEIMQELRHPNIVLLLDSFETKTEVVVVTEYAEGDLFETLDNNIFPESQVREIACQLLSALHYLHSHRVLHRDLKPQNILVCKGGVVKLCDFGFARAMSVSTLVLTSVKGTPLYISPEMVQEKPYDHTADLWALGCILYELHTGFPPFYSKSFIEVMRLITNDPVKWPDNMSQDCKSLLKGLLNKDPQTRLTWPDLLYHPFVAGGVKVLPYEDLCCPLTIAPSPDIQAMKQQQMAKKSPRCKKDQTQNGKKLVNRQPCTRTAPVEEAPARNRSLGRKSTHPPADQHQASNIDLPSVSWSLCKDSISRDYEREFGPRLIVRRSRDSHTSFRKRKENKEQDSVNTDEESQQLAEVTGHTPVPLDPYIFQLKINLFRCKKQLLFGKLDEPSTILRSLNILTHFILTFDAAHVRRISEEIDVLHILFSLIKVILNRPEVMKEPWSEKVLAELMTVLLPIWENQPDWQIEKNRAEDLCQLLISQFLQSDPNALAPQAAAVLNLFVRYGVCVNIHMDRLTALLENLLSGPEKPHYPLPPGWGMCDGVLALILYFLFESESSALYDFLDSEVWSHLWTKVGTILESTASKPDFLSEDGLSVLLRITLFAFSNVPDYCLFLFLDDDRVIRILCHLLTTHNSAPHKRGVLWAGSDMNSLAIMSCQLLCFPFALELPQEKMAAILHSYQSLNIVKGLVKEIQLQSPDVLELPFSLLWRLCLAFPNYAVSSFITAAQDCGFLPQSAPLDQTLNNQKTSGSAPEQPICYPNSQHSKNTSVKVMKMGFHSKIKQDLQILSMEQDSLDQQSDDMDFLDSLEFHTGFSKHYLTAQSDISWIIDSLEHPKNSLGHTEVIRALYCPKASEVKTQPEIRTASSLLSMLLETESMFGCAVQLLTLLCQTCTSGSALFKVPVDPVVLRVALRHHDDGVRAAGCKLLTCLNPDFRRVFTTSNAGPNWTIKPAVFMDLLNCLSDSAPSVRRKACKAVAKWLGLIRKTEVTLKRDQNLQDGTEFSGRTAKETINTRVQSIRQRTKSDSGSHLISIRTEIEWEEWLEVALQAASPVVYILSDPDAVIRQQGCIIIEHIAAITGGRKVLMSTGASHQLLHLSRFDSHHAVQKLASYTLSFVSRTN